LSHHVGEERADLFGFASVNECELGTQLESALKNSVCSVASDVQPKECSREM
jgi:hypothetical protein